MCLTSLAPLRGEERLKEEGLVGRVEGAIRGYSILKNRRVREGEARRLTSRLGLRGFSLVLDVGCGFGFQSAELARSNSYVVGLDLSRTKVLWARKRFKDGSLDFILGDSHFLPVRDGIIDLAFSSYLLEFVDRPKALGEIGRALMAEHRLVASVPDARWWLLSHLPMNARDNLAKAFLRGLKLLERLIRASKARGGRASARYPSREAALGSGRFLSRVSALLLPVHGSYESWRDEVRAYRKQSWARLFEASSFKVEKVMAPRRLLMLPIGVCLTFQLSKG